MIKKVLIPAIIAVVGIAVASGVYQSFDAQKQYQLRSETASNNVPHSMAWTRVDLNTGEYNPELMLQEKAKLNHMNQRGDLGLTFVNKGPDNFGGRSRAVLEIYGEPDRLLAGGVTGGLFISEDGGGSWTPHTAFQNLAESSSMIASIHEDTVNGVIYVGTGSSFDDGYSNFPGYGIYKSTDGGETFQHLSSTAPDERSAGRWTAVNRIRTNMQGHIYAATESSLMLSTDGGDTWSNVLYLGGNPQNGTCADVGVTEEGVVLASLENGRVYISEDGTDGSFLLYDASAFQNRSGISRTCLTISPQNPDVMYLMFVTQDATACFNSIFKTTDGGETWNLHLQKFPGFDPMFNGQYCQSNYDATIHVSPTDDNTIYIGGVTLYRFDGNLTRIATNGGGLPIGDLLPNFVHSDKHYITSSPNNPNRLYVTSDGGISRSTDNGDTWRGLNKGFVTTQFYGIAHASDENVIMGGTQDQGTPAVLGDNPNDPNAAINVSGGDGFDCAISQYSDIYFSTSQLGVIYRGEAGLPSASLADGDQATPGDFYTNVRLWESKNDLTSKDSLLFTVDPFLQSIATSNGIIRNYSETVTPVQPDAIIIQESLTVKSGAQQLTLEADLTTLEGDGEGSVTWNSDGSFAVQVTFDVAPAENSNIDVEYEVRFEANSILYVESKNMKSNSVTLLIEHRLESDLNPGDQIKIQDPAQSMLATDAFAGLHIYRNVLNASDLPVGEQIAIPGIGNVQEIQFTKDGNTLFAGTSSGAVYRVTGLNELYTSDDVANLEIDNILNVGGTALGIAIDPNDANRLVVTGTGFGSTNRVRYSTNALSTNPTFTNVHGNLPEIPVFAAVIDMNNPNFVVIGTEFGVFATADITQGAGTVWSNESNETGYVPVYDVQQQQLPWSEAKNSGKIYVGTFGRGFFESGDLVGIQNSETSISKDAISNLTVFPNPMNDRGTVKLESAISGIVDITVYDLSGRVVKNWTERVTAGQNEIRFDTRTLKTGTYFMTIGNGDSLKSAKFMVMN
jgi:photosystem II stability/assembly factor-like uncharacterized protein